MVTGAMAVSFKTKLIMASLHPSTATVSTFDEVDCEILGALELKLPA